MRKTGNLRRIVSGLLAGMTILSTVLSPMTAYAAEMKPDEKPPLYEEVKIFWTRMKWLLQRIMK